MDSMGPKKLNRSNGVPYARGDSIEETEALSAMVDTPHPVPELAAPPLTHANSWSDVADDPAALWTIVQTFQDTLAA